jgi:hypothetical protein
MCLECDGYSHEEVLQALDLRIRVNGWTLIQVQDDDGSGWCYTVGLLEHFGHPELCAVDVDLPVAAQLISSLVSGIAARRKLAPNGFELLGVHHSHLDSGWFAMWSELNGRSLQPGQMLQVMLPSTSYCADHAPVVRRLDVPGPTPGGSRRPNREERRQRQRHRRGRAA